MTAPNLRTLAERATAADAMKRPAAFHVFIAAASPSVAIELGALVDALTDGRGVYADKESSLISRCRELFGRQP